MASVFFTTFPLYSGDRRNVLTLNLSIINSLSMQKDISNISKAWKATLKSKHTAFAESKI